MMKNRKFVWFLVVLFLFFLLGCSGGAALTTATPPPATQPPIKPTDTAVVKSETVPAEIYDDYYARKTKEGMAAVEAFLVDHPENGEAIALRAGFLKRLKNYDAALTDANHALELDSNLAFAHAIRADILLAQNGNSSAEEARAETDKALQLDPNLALGYMIRGSIEFNKDGNVEQAKADAQQALKLQPDYISAQLFLADRLMDDGDYQKAIAMYDNLLDKTDDPATVLSQRSYAKYQLGDLDGAIADATASIQANANSPAPYVWRGFAYDDQGDSEKALADYEMAISLGTKNSDAYTDAALIIAYQDNSDLQKAMDYTNKALELSPGDVYALDAQGDVYYFMGEYEKAIQVYTTAIDNGYEYSYIGRGDCYYKLGQNDKAISDYKAFLAAYPDSSNADYVKKQLASLGVQVQ